MSSAKLPALNGLARMRMAPSHRCVRFGSFEMDEIAGEPRKDGTKIRLQEQPFQILQILLEQPGEVVTRELDFSGVYEPPFGALGRTMNAIMGHRIAEVSVHSFVNDVAGYLRPLPR